MPASRTQKGESRATQRRTPYHTRAHQKQQQASGTTPSQNSSPTPSAPEAPEVYLPESSADEEEEQGISAETADTSRTTGQEVPEAVELLRDFETGIYTVEGVGSSVQVGGFNAVVKAVIEEKEGSAGEQEVAFRFPREEVEEAPVYTTQAVLHAVLHARELGLGIPAILKFDSTEDNKLNSPYEVMQWVSGVQIGQVYRSLPLLTRCQVAKRMAEVIANLETVTFQCCGDIVALPAAPAALELGHDPQPLTHHLGIAMREYARPTRTRQPTQVRDIRTLFEWRLDTLAQLLGRGDKDLPKLRRVLRDFDTAGFFKLFSDRPKHLQHHDLFPRNVMGRFAPASGFLNDFVPPPQAVLLDPEHGEEFRLDAVIDWDDAMVVPNVLSRSPPGWLWDETCETDGDIDIHAPPEANFPSADQVVKTYFEAEVEKLIPGYLADAYGEEAVWLRRLWRRILYTNGSGTCETVEQFMADWSLSKGDYINNGRRKKKTR